MTALMEDPRPRGHTVSRKEAARVLRQVATGIGAILLAAVDDWNALSQRHSAHLRTEMHALGRGAYVAAITAACTDVWLSTHGKHPPGHVVSKPHRWPVISSHGRTYMAIHHNEMEPTNARRTAFCNQDSETLGLIGDPTHCEITWEYDQLTDLNIKRIWVSAPGVDWNRFEIPMGRVQGQLTRWRKRKMKWLPGALPIDSHAVVSLPAREDLQRLRPGIDVQPPQRSEDTRDAE
ncbi:hypothetical protein [Mycolicibacterium fortuitum]|uniref:hypothetical protein n=1 Tax=Mycolicibacterium fortuitum TaxID=1766 RepID=UPI001F39736C|nr:hypothetical protein [Mycolicibacterium fortuitum]